MAYATSGLIEATDYNNLAWGGTQGVYTSATKNVAYVMGVGSGAVGYGQDVSTINTVAAAATVTATQWAGLLTKANQALGHQSGAGAQLSVPTITVGGVITYSSILQTAATTINTNSASYAASGATITGTTNSFNPTAGTGALSWIGDTRINFASSNAARYFFNAGGYFNFYCSASDNAGTSRSQSMRDLINNAGGFTSFKQTTNSGRTGTGGSLAINDGGIGHRTAGDALFCQVNDDAPYGGSYSQIQIVREGADGTNGAMHSTNNIRLRGYLAADDAFGGAANITVNTRIDIVYPESTYLTTAAWGTPSVSFAWAYQ
jgi:hypothetical protein